MASSLQLISSLFLIAAVSLLISPANSQTCKSQTFNGTFENCEDLPTLNAFIHWTYKPSATPNPTLDIAFIAPPAGPDGWVAWALNPTRTGMLGAQSLIAFRDTNGSIVVKTYNISSYSSIAESRISYEVLSKKGENSDGVMRIFATLGLPSPSSMELNQVWQVGASVSNGVPSRHALLPENLRSVGTLKLESSPEEDGNGPTPAPTSGGGSGAPTPTRRNGNDTGSGSMIRGSGFVLCGVLVLIGVFLGF